jgi:hypothetical protein
MGFAAVAEVYFTFWETTRTSGMPGSEKYKLPAERALQVLRTYKGVFPIGQAYAWYYQGLHEAMVGKKETAIKSWKHGLDAAQKFKQLHEEGLIRMRLGAHETDTSARAEHFNRAIAIFEAMGASHELQIAKETVKRFQ